MSIAGIKVLTVGKAFPLPYEMRHCDGTSNLIGTIAEFRPDVIVTSTFHPSPLNLSPFEIRKRWIHVDPNSKIEAIQQAIENCYSFNIWNEHPNQKDHPLISVYTGTYNTGDYLRKTFESLREQSYANWEWVVVDDHSIDGTWERLEAMAKEDIRVRPFRSGKRLEKIGLVKDTATKLCRGDYLVELDHDDMLTDFALFEIKKAFESDPEIGFVYSNCANVFESGEPHRFTDDFWKDRYRETEYRGKKYIECVNPEIYGSFGKDFRDLWGWFLTVGPNHVRAFRASKFRELGGYNESLLVADDWDLYSRFFLYSKCHHIDKMCYIYLFKDAWGNTTFTRNKAIQDHLALGRNHRAEEFKKYNDKRLSGKVEPEIALTIVVPSMESRMKSLVPVISNLFEQAKGKPVEVVCLLDNKVSNLSEKRNQAIANAKGKFITFVDDDDEVDPEYVDSILKEIHENPSTDCVVFDVLVQGYDAASKVCKYGIEYSHTHDEKFYYRKPNHVMAYRASISKRHLYRKDLSAISEDTEWADRASIDIKSQVRIDRVLYLYKYDPKTTTQKNPHKGVESLPPVLETGPRTLKEVSFIVLEAGGPMPQTTKCLESIRKYAPESEIILVENGCITAHANLALADNVIELHANLGFAAGCNVGAKAATRPFLCFCNNDMVFLNDTPTKLLQAITPEYAIVGPYSNAAKPPQGDILPQDTPKETIYAKMVVGLCMMVPAALYWQVGGFDPRLLTYEDDDFCARASYQTGCKIVGGAYVDHERHATFQKLGLDVNKVMADNKRIFDRKDPDIRVIVIAKDEEKSIEGFFSQFKGITSDFSLLDTGSTDKTVEKAKELGVKVETSFLIDFEKARNEAVERFGAGADWIIMFDPDERLDEITLKNLKEFFFNTTADIILSPLTAVYPNGTRQEFVPKPFAWRNRPQIHWEFKVHEKLIGSTRQVILKNSLIEHLIELHDDGRRQKASGFYDALMKAEPYFTDPEYKKKITSEWPILDYDHKDDPRIEKAVIGPLVSVIIPTFKRAQLLFPAIDSALKQDYTNLEIVVVGDDCPDLGAIMKMNFKWFDRMRVYNLNQNHGFGGAAPRNHGIAAAAGDLIAYLDDDNKWKPNHLSTLFDAMGGASFAFSSMEVSGVDLGFKYPRQGGIDTSCLLHRKELFYKYGPWKNREEGYAHDWEIVNRWLTGGEPWAASGKPTLIYNAETSMQKEYLQKLVSEKAAPAAAQ